LHHSTEYEKSTIENQPIPMPSKINVAHVSLELRVELSTRFAIPKIATARQNPTAATQSLRSINAQMHATVVSSKSERIEKLVLIEHRGNWGLWAAERIAIYPAARMVCA